MNLILLHAEDFIDDNRVKLYSRRHAHIAGVLSATPGKALQVGLLNGKTGVGTVVELLADSVLLDVQLNSDPPKPLAVTLILAMPRPKVFKRLLQGITSLGIKRIILLNTWKVDKSYWQSPALTSRVIQEQCILGLEQSRDTILPSVDMQTRFKPFVEDTLPSIAADTCALVAHPGGAQSCPVNVMEQITLAVGPEGGFTDYEIAKLEEAGLLPMSLGRRPLRVETAIPALIGRLAPFHC